MVSDSFRLMLLNGMIYNYHQYIQYARENLLFFIENCLTILQHGILQKDLIGCLQSERSDFQRNDTDEMAPLSLVQDSLSLVVSINMLIISRRKVSDLSR